ncbi:MAG TPA: phasin family protein [Roseiarcus sp.]|nr:phasin family protein [Roseiarcus sp.]
MAALSFENFQNLSKQQVEAATAFAATLSKGLQEIAAETAEYSKHSLSAGAEAMERLMGAKSVETAVQIQTDYAKSAFEGFVAKSTKINEIFAKLAADAMKPAQSAFSPDVKH